MRQRSIGQVRSWALLAFAIWTSSGAVLGAEVRVDTSAERLPAGFPEKLAELARTGTAIQAASISNNGEWVIVAGNRAHSSPGFPQAALREVDRFRAEGAIIQAVEAQGPRWVVVANGRVAAEGVPEDALAAIRRLHSQMQPVTSFSFMPAAPEDWVLTAGGQAFHSRGVPRGLMEAVEVARTGRRWITGAVVAAPDSWLLIAQRWFVSEGAPPELLASLDGLRTGGDRSLDLVLLRRNGGWAVASNGSPRAFFPADQLETGLGSGGETLYQRMQAHGIPALAIAWVEGNQRAWTRTWGVRDTDLPESWVVPDTVFDAGSIAKPVTTVTALRAVDSGQMDLTSDYSSRGVTGMPELFRAGSDTGMSPGMGVSLARLLSHCAGLGFRKQAGDPEETGVETFEAGQAVPTLRQVLLGQAPADTAYQVVRVGNAGAQAVYSGVNHTLVQALLDEAARGGFAGQTRGLFAQLGMESSGFDQPLPAVVERRAAWGYRRGNKQARKMRAAQGAAGLWSTAADLGNFVAMLNNRGGFGGRQVVSEQMVDAMLGRNPAVNAACANRETPGGYVGLGIYLDPRRSGSRDEIYWHRGTQGGQRAYIIGLPRLGRGLAVMMSGGSRDADAFARELFDRISAVYSLQELPIR